MNYTHTAAVSGGVADAAAGAAPPEPSQPSINYTARSGTGK